MKAQTPAKGIMIQNDWGDSKLYKAVCECMCDDCNHTLDIEAEEFHTTVTIHTVQHTDFWSTNVDPNYDIDNPWLQEFNWFWTGLWNGLIRRLKLTRDIWFNGRATYQCSLILDEQMALNYAETLKSAIKDVRVFKEGKKDKSAAAKLAEQQDCV